jgi:gliding motility-associated-like protein
VVCPGDFVTITANSASNAQYFWSGPSNFSSTNSVISLPVQEVNMGIYSVYVIVDGCQSVVSTSPVSIQNLNGFDDFEFPNVITPNGDGVNDSLNINDYFKTCQEYTLVLYNRWGQVIFEQSIGTPSFAGKTKDDADLVEGVYFYTLTFGEERKNGFLHIIR